MNAPANITADDAFRAAHVGASEVAALFDQHPWLTRYQLWHQKAGNIGRPDFAGNERVEWGVRLEPVIIQAACDRWGYRPIETPPALSNGRGLGGHPDKIVMCPERGRTVLEAKSVDWLVAKQWGDEPPLHYLLQPQSYMGLDGAEHADLIILVGGNELRRLQYQFRPVIFTDIEARVAEFWRSIHAGDEPPPDYKRDGKTIVDVFGTPTNDMIDLRHDRRADELAIEYLDAKAVADEASSRADAAKAELMHKIGDAGFAMLGCHKISAGMTKGSDGKLITPEMVGTYVGARKGWRRFDVKEMEND